MRIFVSETSINIDYILIYRDDNNLHFQLTCDSDFYLSVEVETEEIAIKVLSDIRRDMKNDNIKEINVEDYLPLNIRIGVE